MQKWKRRCLKNKIKCTQVKFTRGAQIIRRFRCCIYTKDIYQDTEAMDRAWSVSFVWFMYTFMYFYLLPSLSRSWFVNLRLLWLLRLSKYKFQVEEAFQMKTAPSDVSWMLILAHLSAFSRHIGHPCQQCTVRVLDDWSGACLRHMKPFSIWS